MKILPAVLAELKNGPATLDELFAVVGGRMNDLTKALNTGVKRELLKREMIDGGPGYKITQKGRDWSSASSIPPAEQSAPAAGGQGDNTGSDSPAETPPGGDVAVQPDAVSSTGVGSAGDRGEADVKGTFLLHIIDCIRDALPGGDRLKLEELPEAVRQQFLRSQKLEGIERDCEKQVANYKDQLKRSEAYALSWEQKMEAAIGHDNVDNVVELIAKLKAELATERQAREALQEQLDSAQADPGVDVKDAAKGYLVRAPKRKLRVCNRGELAVQAAKAAAKNGSGYADVYALVQMGRAVRGAEWVESK